MAATSIFLTAYSSAYSYRKFEVEIVAIASDHDSTVRGFLGYLYLLQSFRYLGIKDYVLVSGRIRDDSAEGLVEPASYSVEAVMHPASSCIPMFPGAGRTIVNHIEIAWIAMLLEHAVHKLTLPCQSCPLGNDRNTHKSSLQMPFIDGLRPFNQFVTNLGLP